MTVPALVIVLWNIPNFKSLLIKSLCIIPSRECDVNVYVLQWISIFHPLLISFRKCTSPTDHYLTERKDSLKEIKCKLYTRTWTQTTENQTAWSPCEFRIYTSIPKSHLDLKHTNLNNLGKSRRKPSSRHK
jgi:hypothetical protein